MDTGALITRDGAVRFMPDGRLVTDKAGAPCCCGGAPGCCFCSDIAAAPGAPCYEASQPGSCGPPACCCGKSWEWAMKIGTRLEKPDGFWSTTEIDLLARIDMIDKAGSCVRQVTPLRDYWRGRNSNGYDKIIDPSGLALTGNLFNSTSFYCRVTGTVFESIIYTADGGKPIKTGQQKISNVFYAPPCNGEKKVGEFHSLAWTTSGNCNSGKATYTESADYFGTNNDYIVRATGAWSVKRLQAECCPDTGPTLTPSGPANPANPSVGNPGVQAGGCGGCGDGAEVGEEL